MKILNASIPTKALLKSIKDKCMIKEPSQFVLCMGYDEGGCETGPVYHSSYWLKDIMFPNITSFDREFKYHLNATDMSNEERSYSGTGLENEKLIRPVLETDFVGDENKRYRIGEYVFETIPDKKMLICTSFIGLSTYADNAYITIPDNPDKSITRSDAHDYEKSNIKKIVDEWFETKIKNKPITELKLMTVPIEVNTTVKFTDWVKDEKEALCFGKKTLDENLENALTNIKKISI